MKSKFENLKKYLLKLNEQGICLAFSGGIDSTLLLYLCKNMNILALTFNSTFQTKEEIKETKKICKKYKVKQIIYKYDILKNKKLLNNPKNRCYICKKYLFKNAIKIAKENNINYIIEGSNFDDLKEYRPGRKALSELKIISPYIKFKITKEEIRNYSKLCGIEIFSKPSTPCLATRFPYGVKLAKSKLKLIEKGEKILKNLKFNCCRLRLHDNVGRIEILQKDFNNFLEKKEEIINEFKKLKIKYITLDLEGFRSGSMDL